MSSQPTHEWRASKSTIWNGLRDPCACRCRSCFRSPKPDRSAPVTGWAVSAGRPCDKRHLAPTRGEVSEYSWWDGQSEPRLNCIPGS